MKLEIETIVDLFDEFYLVSDITSKEELITGSTNKEETVTNNTPAIESNQSNTLINDSLNQPQNTINLPKIEYAGKNQKHIVFIYNDTTNDSKENALFIQNIFQKALQLQLDDIAIIRISKNPTLTKNQILEELSPKQIIIFGTQPFFPATSFHQILVENNTKILLADAPENYHESKEKKLVLWNLIQQIFQ